MGNNKLKLDANLPWDPTCWVGDGRAVPIKNYRDDSPYKYAAVKAIAAIMRAKRHDAA